MTQFRIEKMTAKFSIVKDHLWCIYDGERPVFHGSADECRDWLDRHEALSQKPHELMNNATADPPVSFWSKLARFSFRRSHTA